MQQRVAIALALACDPRLSADDEPVGSACAQTRADLEDLVLAVRQQRDMTILLVTHDIDESVYVADRVVVLTPARPDPGRPARRPARPARSDQHPGRPAFARSPRATMGRLVRS